MTESVILSAIRKALGRKPDLALWRYSPGITESPEEEPGKRYKAGLSVRGGSDLIGVLTPLGRWFALEVKTPEHLGRILRAQARGDVSGLSDTDRFQILFIGVIRAHGGFAAFVESVESAEAAYERAKQGATE